MESKRTQHARNLRRLVGDEEGGGRRLRPERLQLVLGEKLCDRRAHPPLLVEDVPGTGKTLLGKSLVISGIDIEVNPGEIAVLLGRNGAGKTTTLKAIMGVVPRREGSILFENRQTVKLASNRIARLTA